jgi:hypothetical protein
MEDDKMKVFEEPDGTLVIEWEDDHPYAEIFKSWKEEDWINAIRRGNELRELEENGKQTGEGLPEEISPEPGHAEDPQGGEA